MSKITFSQNTRKKLFRQLLYIVAAFAVSEFDILETLYHKQIINFLICYGFLMLIIEVNLIVVNLIRKKNKSISNNLSHIFVQILSASLVTFLLVLVFTLLQRGKLAKVGEIAIISALIAIMVITIFEANYFFSLWKNYIVRAERIEKANLVAKYETLKKQVHPHFLFNGLNTLIGLIESGDKKAAEYAQKMSDFLKYLLTHQQKETISLAEELNIVRQYAFIQQVRFNENLKVIIDIDNTLETKTLPPLALQMLVENAIKHNIVSAKYPLIISIRSIGDLRVQIENSVKKKQHTKSASIGLNNIFERYKHLKADEPVIEETDNKFIVKLPLI